MEINPEILAKLKELDLTHIAFEDFTDRTLRTALGVLDSPTIIPQRRVYDIFSDVADKKLKMVGYGRLQ